MPWIDRRSLLCLALAAWCFQAVAPVAGGGTDEKTRPFERIDRHALAAPREVEQSIPTLAAYLVKPARNEQEKVRAIYRWMTDRIAYNAADFLAGGPRRDSSAAGVLKSRKSVCAGYANLFEALCKEAGVEVAKIRGYAKGFGYTPGEEISSSHVWNAVKIGKQWRLIDVTWAAGSVEASKGFIKRLDEFYFLTSPDQLIFSHFPDDPKWQLLTPAVAKAEFQAWPKLSMVWFQSVAPAKLREALSAKGFRGLPMMYTNTGRVHLRQAPLRKHLKAGESISIVIEAPGCFGMAVINNKKWQLLKRIAGPYRATIKPEKGVLKISGKFSESTTSYGTVLEYIVE